MGSLVCRGKLTFLLPSGSRPPSFSPTALPSSSRLSSSYKWLQGCCQAGPPRRSLRVALARSLEEQPGSPAPCPSPRQQLLLLGCPCVCFCHTDCPLARAPSQVAGHQRVEHHAPSTCDEPQLPPLASDFGVQEASHIGGVVGS